MSARKFELFIGCFGNGTTVCNKAVIENGDFKHIAHITPYGKIKLYVPKDYIPTDAMERIRTVAEKNRRKFLEWWNHLPIETRYEKMLDSLPLRKSIEFLGDAKGNTIEERIVELERILSEMV